MRKWSIIESCHFIIKYFLLPVIISSLHPTCPCSCGMKVILQRLDKSNGNSLMFVTWLYSQGYNIYAPSIWSSTSFITSCQIFGLRRTPSVRPSLLNFHIDRPIYLCCRPTRSLTVVISSKKVATFRLVPVQQRLCDCIAVPLLHLGNFMRFPMRWRFAVSQNVVQNVEHSFVKLSDVRCYRYRHRFWPLSLIMSPSQWATVLTVDSQPSLTLLIQETKT